MTLAVTVPFDSSDESNYGLLRSRWYGRLLSIESSYNAEIRKSLRRGGLDASKRIKQLELQKTKTPDTKVRIAQLRIAKIEIKTVLKDVFDDVHKTIKSGHKEAAKAATDALTDTDRRYLRAALGSSDAVDGFIRFQRASAMLSVENAINRITKSRQPLSSRVYTTRSLANHWVDNLLTSSIMRGDSAQEIAEAVRKYIRPDTPGGVSYAAMRLGRTELNNAFHATSVTLSQDRPWIESMAWNLSATHDAPRTYPPEICEVYAARRWDVDNVPPKPHPNCRCFVTPKLEAYETFVRHLNAGQYREWVENAA